MKVVNNVGAASYGVARGKMAAERLNLETQCSQIISALCIKSIAPFFIDPP
jgi:hypothetical protein